MTQAPIKFAFTLYFGADLESFRGWREKFPPRLTSLDFSAATPKISAGRQET